MSEEEYNDPFAGAFREKLEKHRLEPNPQDWEKIQSSLGKKSRNYRWVIWAAAASVLLFFGTFDRLEDKRLPENTSALPALSLSADIAEEPEIIAKAEVRPEVSIATESGPAAKPAPIADPKPEVHAEPETQPALLAETRPESKPDPVTGSEKKKTGELKSEPLEEIKEWENDIQTDISDWQLIASVGSNYTDNGNGSDLLSGLLSNRDFVMLSDLAENEQTILAYIPSPSEFSKREYMLPVSVGLNISKSIGNGFSLGSGLSYSFLETRFSGHQWGNFHTSLKLHYLGIPLDLQYEIGGTDPWKYGFSAGIKAEKGLLSDYEQTEDASWAVYNTRVKERIKGLQWSTHLAFNINYELDRNWMLFVSPRLSYYFDNDQPISIRTDEPLQFTLHGGLKFAF